MEKHTQGDAYIKILTVFLVGVLSWIIGWKRIQRDCHAVPVALSAMVNNEAHKHERQEDDRPDLSYALKGAQLRFKDFKHTVRVIFN